MTSAEPDGRLESRSGPAVADAEATTGAGATTAVSTTATTGEHGPEHGVDGGGRP